MTAMAAAHQARISPWDVPQQELPTLHVAYIGLQFVSCFNHEAALWGIGTYP